MVSPIDQTSPAEANFHHFSLLACELQCKILKHAAEEWITSQNSGCGISHWGFGTHVQIQKTKIYKLPYEDDNFNTDPARMTPRDMAEADRVEASNAVLAARLVLPDLFSVNTLARSVMYDTFVDCREVSYGSVKQNTDLYCEDNLIFGNTSAPDFGVRIQDFRQPGLEDRVIEEYGRLDESYLQFMETIGKMERKERSPGYVMLPGNKNFVHQPVPVCGLPVVLQNYPAGSEHLS